MKAIKRIGENTKMKALKKNRLRMLVAQRSITQQQANQLWRDYLRGQIPMGKLPKIGQRSICSGAIVGN